MAVALRHLFVARQSRQIVLLVIPTKELAVADALLSILVRIAGHQAEADEYEKRWDTECREFHLRLGFGEPEARQGGRTAYGTPY